MARVTTEDCVDKVPNRFDLVMLAAHRAREIAAGAPLTVDRDNDKNPVVALREIADETQSAGDLRERLIENTEAMLEAVGLEDQALHRPGELSGGQRQRVAIARALVTHPELVLADEPTANLDTRTGETIIDLMREMRGKLGTTFVIATHAPLVAERAPRRVELRDGRISEDLISEAIR